MGSVDMRYLSPFEVKVVSGESRYRPGVVSYEAEKEKMIHDESLAYAFVARIKAREGKESELRVTGAAELANAEEGTEVWFAATTSPDTFWVFDAFSTQEARQAYADGEIVKALNANAGLLAEDPEILPADILASKLP